jgi:hypothetical protein
MLLKLGIKTEGELVFLPSIDQGEKILIKKKCV